MLKADLRKYQKRGVAQAIRKFNGRCLLADDMGLGKTLQAIAIVNKLPEQLVLVACPSSLKYNWVDELQKFLPHETPYVCAGQKPLKNKDKKHRIFICNYEILSYWRDFFVKIGVNVLICDESHYLKNKSAKRTKAATVIAKQCDYRILLTGTPIENNPGELYSQLRIINSKLFPSWLLFVKRYCGARRSQYGWQLTSATHVKELNRKLLDTCMVRRKKENVLTELPAKVRKVVPLEISNRTEYEEAKKDIIKWLKKNTKLNLEKAKKAQAMVKLDKLKLISAKGKIDQVVSWINENSPTEKLVVFCYHKKVLEELTKKIKHHVLVDSTLVGKERQNLVHKFQEDDKVRVFLTTIRVGGTGLTLTASSTTVFVQQDWNASKHDQAEDRVYRIGQKADSVNAIYFIAKDTIEEKISKLIDAKRQDSTAVIDGEEVKQKELLTELLKDFN